MQTVLVYHHILAHLANITPKPAIAYGMYLARIVLSPTERKWFSSMRFTPVSMRGVCVNVERNSDGCVRDIGKVGENRVRPWRTHNGNGSKALNSSESTYKNKISVKIIVFCHQLNLASQLAHF